MAGQTVTLPKDLSDWAEAQATAEQRASISDYVCTLVERERERQAKIAAMDRMVEEGYASGFFEKSMEEIKLAAIERCKERGLL
jgi:antitoxin ParD1/3/4